ncbi:hypothetical protein JCM19992_15670 [Thermostilla marina]
MVVTALIVILGLATIRQVYQWWREAPVASSPPNEPAKFLPRDVLIAETDWSLSLRPFQGDRESLDSQLTALCRDALSKAAFPSTPPEASEAAYMAEGPGEVVDEFTVETTRDEHPAAFRAMVCRPWIDYPLLVGILSPPETSNNDPGISEPTAETQNHRVAAWVTAVPLGNDRYTLYAFCRTEKSCGRNDFPRIALPRGAKYTLTLSDAHSAVMAGFAAPNADTAGWRDHFDDRLAAVGFTAADEWLKLPNGMCRRYTREKDDQRNKQEAVVSWRQTKSGRVYGTLVLSFAGDDSS